MGTPPERHLDFDEPPRLWVEHVLAERIGPFPKSDEATKQFLAVYDQKPTLAALGTGSPRDRDCFVLAVAVLMDETLDDSRRWVTAQLARLDAQERSELVARSLAIARLREAIERDASALGPDLKGTLETVLTGWDRAIPPEGVVQHVSTVFRLLYGLDFILGHVQGLKIMERRRLVARLVREWKGYKITEDSVRLNVKRRLEAAQQRQPACAGSPVAALYFPTHAAVLVGLTGRLRPLGPHEACETYHPAVVGRICLRFRPTVPAPIAVKAREFLVRRLAQVDLSVLPTTASAQT